MVSLHRRLLLVAVAALAAAMILSGLGLTYVFERTIRARVVADIADQIDVLLQGLQVGPDNRLVLNRQPSDPRFERPYGGFYWQLGRRGEIEARSRSLWNEDLTWRAEPPRFGETRSGIVAGPSRQELVYAERRVMIDGPEGATPVRLMVALDDNELVEARTAFFESIIPSLAALGGSLLLGLWAFLRFGLRPLQRLKRALAEVRANRSQTIKGEFPAEVMPLVDEVNALIAARTQDLLRARARAGDLAHALKTPLAVLSAKARRLHASGQADAAIDIGEEVERLEKIVKRELLLARASLHAARNWTHVPLRPEVERSCRAIGTLAKDKALKFKIGIADDAIVAVNDTDLLEMLGNLIDNAAKWARSTVVVETVPAPEGMIGLAVSDDGRGLTEAEATEALKPGVRLDEQIPGHGLGLGITRDLVEAYGGELTLGRDPAQGGLRATLLLPQAA